jgi:triacylglycerol lipase
MKKRLEKNGFKCFAPTLKPIDAKYGLDNLAEKLKNKIDEHFGNDSEFALIGFSMGGIICRYYLQELNGFRRVNKFITISSPHNGTYVSYLYPGKGLKQLRPDSEFLNNLNSDNSFPKNKNFYSFWTPFDLLILPHKNSIWQKAVNKKYYSLLHSYMLFNPNVIRDVITILSDHPVN